MFPPKQAVLRLRWRYAIALALFLLVACNPINLPAPKIASHPIETPSRQGTVAQVHADPIERWQPQVGMGWQWQLTDTPVDLDLDVDIYDIDLFDNDVRVVTALHARGRKVFCYISAGSREDWRPDADQFPAFTVGKDYEGWPGENWLDIRQIDALAPILQARMDLCQAKGFDGIEPDNIDGFTNDTGFALSYEDQLQYNRWLAAEAHARGLSIGLKNDPDQVTDLLPDFDWALTEDCFAEGWCEAMLPFIQAQKPVLAAEYTDTGNPINELCPQAQELKFSLILKNRNLDAWLKTCD